jgi:poly(3-hydroxyalkanoate) depolymerase
MDPSLTVITFDVPGVGASPAPLLPYTLAAMARTVAAMLDALGYAEVSVLGLSWGGFLAQQIAKDHPTLCTKLILAATSAGVISVYPSPKVLSLMVGTRRYEDAAYGASIAPHIYGGLFRNDPELCAHHFHGMKAPPSGRGYHYQGTALWGWTSLHWLHKIRQSTLVLAGNDDPLIPLINMRALAWLIPDSDLRVIDDGHLFMATQPQMTADMVSTFLLGGTQ